MISQLEVSVESNSTEVKFMKIIFVRDDQHKDERKCTRS